MQGQAMMLDEIEADVKESQGNKLKSDYFDVEPIAALIAYVRANEELIETWKPLDLAAMSLALKLARKNLGLD